MKTTVRLKYDLYIMAVVYKLINLFTLLQQRILLRLFDGTDRLCKVVKLSMQCCGQIL